MKNGRAGSAVNKYWRLGVVGGVIVIDSLALGIGAVDVVRFLYTGHSFGAAVSVAAEKLREGREIGLAVSVLMFFVVALPMLTILISSLVPAKHRWPKVLRARGPGVLATHLLLSFIIAAFTIVAMAMEVLAGYENNEVVRYSFVSTWLGIVFLGKPLWVSYISPIIRKFFIRLPHERENIKKVASEVITEEPFGGERVA